MTPSLHALTAEPWAIRPDYLHFMASLAMLDRDARAERRAAEGEDWFRLDLQAAAGPSAQRMEGARYAMLTGEGVAVIPVVGPIFPRANVMTEMSGSGTSAAMLARDLQLARDSADVGAILLMVDSPGGSPTGINAVADQLYAMRGRKRVVAHVSGSAASAAYWIVSSAGEIATDKTGMLGSIGVVAALTKQVEPDASGTLAIQIVSTNAPNKRPDPQTEDGAAQIRSLLDSIETQFIADVARGRRTTPARVKSDFGAGGTKVGADAVAAGMADRVQSYAATFKDLARTAANERAVRASRP